ncbi:hypothetical protein Tco_0171141 [Tanacetum coccineum]
MVTMVREAAVAAYATVKGGGARCRDSEGWEMMILGGGRSGSGVRGGCCGVVGVKSDDGSGVVVGWRWWRQR